MELLMIMTYTAFCWAVFKIFKLPLNKWTVPTAILGGVVLIGLVLVVMNYNHPYSTLVREYFVTTPIVPDVQGQVVEVPVEANQPLKEGDVLFRIDPAPYQYEVDRLEAALADAKSGAAQLEERLRAAEAAAAQARSNILTSESEYGRQAREALAEARAAVVQMQAQLELAREQYDRYQRLLSTNAVAEADFDRAKRNFESAQAQLSQAQAAERQAAEKLESGGDRVQAAREQLRSAEAQEREARLAFEAESGGVNPKVRQITAELDRARWNLDQTTVRAPTDGFVTQLLLRPGMMAVPMPLRPVMTFIHTTAPTDRVLVGAFWQNSLQRLKPGDEAEVIYSGRAGAGVQRACRPHLAGVGGGPVANERHTGDRRIRADARSRTGSHQTGGRRIGIPATGWCYWIRGHLYKTCASCGTHTQDSAAHGQLAKLYFR